MKLVIIGNSAAALNAIEKIRKYDKDLKIVVISKEKRRAYSRVLLPYYLRGKFKARENLYIRDEIYYEELNIEYIEDEVVKLDDSNKKLLLRNGGNISFDKLLITTGSSPFKPPIKGLDNDGIYHMWTFEDAVKLEPYFKKGNKVLILGSGFVSLQAAWAALVKGLDVYVYELMPRIMPRVLDDKSAGILMEQMIKLGVDLKLKISTQEIKKLENGKLKVCAKGKDDVIVDFIIVGTGVRPNIKFIRNTSIEIDRGILVNEYMETSVKDIYAAGDVTQGPTVFGEKYIIHALWPTAVEQGKIAGTNIIGNREAYGGSLNMNVTQMFDITVASIGNFNEEETSQVWMYDLGEKGFFKVVLEDKVPVGASLVGKSELVEFLGILRPIIRKKVEINCQRDNLFEYLRTKCQV